jgi:hypothetical protein
MIFVLRDGQLVEKTECRKQNASNFPTPMVSRFEAFYSPVTDKSISSWRQRDRDMDAVAAVDRRDIPQRAFDKRKRIVDRNGRAGKTGS